jgi:hypothetical protein
LDKVLLAEGVLRSELQRVGCDEWGTAWWLLCRKHGLHEERWLPKLVEKRGFAAIAKMMSQDVAGYRRKHPRDRLTPEWNGHILSWMEEEWKFRNQRGPVREILDALQASKWQAVTMKNLDADQVSQAARYLRERTRPYIRWSAANDGYVQVTFS